MDRSPVAIPQTFGWDNRSRLRRHICSAGGSVACGTVASTQQAATVMATGDSALVSWATISLRIYFPSRRRWSQWIFISQRSNNGMITGDQYCFQSTTKWSLLLFCFWDQLQWADASTAEDPRTWITLYNILIENNDHCVQIRFEHALVFNVLHAIWLQSSTYKIQALSPEGQALWISMSSSHIPLHND